MIKATRNRVVVKFTESEHIVGGIVVSTTKAIRQLEGEVVSISENSDIVLSIGDRVITSTKGVEVTHEGVKYHIVETKDVLCVIG